jgi:hypothetical protein
MRSRDGRHRDREKVASDVEREYDGQMWVCTDRYVCIVLMPWPVTSQMRRVVDSGGLNLLFTFPIHWSKVDLRLQRYGICCAGTVMAVRRGLLR